MNRKTTLTAALVTIIFVTSIAGIALAQSTQPVESIESTSFGYYLDFEDGQIPPGYTVWEGGIESFSYEDTYSAVGIETTSPPQLDVWDTVYFRTHVDQWTPTDPGFTQQVTPYYDNTFQILYYKNGDACNDGFQYYSWNSNGQYVRTGSDCDLPDGTWLNFVITKDEVTNTADIYVWESGTEIPTTPETTIAFYPNTGGMYEINRIRLGEQESYSSQPATAHLDEFGYEGIDTYEINGTVTNPRDNPIQNATITLNQSGSIVSSYQTGSNGKYSFAAPNGTYNITAKKPGYVNVTKRNIVIDGSGQTVNFLLRKLSAVFDFRASSYMDHGTTQQYSAVYDPVNSATYESVTSETNVTSANTSIVNVNEANNTLIATSNVQINNRTTITATYVRDNVTYTTTQQITVANRTMENIEIMPPSQYIPAALGFGEEGTVFGIGSAIQWVLLAIFIGAGAAWLARNEWVGIGLIVALITFFWVLGNVSLGITMVAVFYGLFAGYQLNKIPGRSDTNVNPSNDVQPPEPPQQ